MRVLTFKLVIAVLLCLPVPYLMAQGKIRAGKGQAAEAIVSDSPPEFPGGIMEFYKYIQENLKYPRQAEIARVSATVLTKFRVSKEGYIDEVKIVKQAGYGLDQEATRILKASPKWAPGIKGGEVTAMWFQVPITFVLPSARAPRNRSLYNNRL